MVLKASQDRRFADRQPPSFSLIAKKTLFISFAKFYALFQRWDFVNGLSASWQLFGIVTSIKEISELEAG